MSIRTPGGAVGANWAGNLRYSASELALPRSLDELAAVIADASARGAGLRALGSRHSFNRIADTPGVLVSVASLPGAVEIDAVRGVASVPGGWRYGDVALALEERGWALATLASLPHISVAGAVATGTHGSGDAVRSLAGAVAGLEIVTASGETVVLRRGDADFAGAVVSLGALGVVTRVELDIEPSFAVAQRVYEGLSWERALADLGAVTGAAYSVSMFTTWSDPDIVNQVWLKARVDDAADASAALPPDVLGALPATEARHPLPGVSAENCTAQLGEPGRWFDRLPHFRMGFTPSKGDELQSEYLVPRTQSVEAIDALRGIADRIAPLLLVSEIRTIAADDLWLSPASGADSVAFHFTWKQDQPAVEAFLPVLEAALAPSRARPHWGKLFAAPAASLRPLYPRWGDFADLRHRFDPQGLFRNAFVQDLGF